MSPSRPTRALRAALAFFTFLLIAAHAPRASADPYSRFYWREAVGIGFFSAQSSYDNDRTRTALGFTFDVASTMGVRLAESFAIGGSLDLMPMPPLSVNEAHGGRTDKEMTASFGWAGLVGPSATFMPGRLRIDLSPGFFWCVTGADEDGGGATLGGFGGGVGASVAYDIPLGERLALGFEGRLLTAAYVNGDPTHHVGWSITPAFLVGLRSR